MAAYHHIDGKAVHPRRCNLTSNLGDLLKERCACSLGQFWRSFILVHMAKLTQLYRFIFYTTLGGSDLSCTQRPLRYLFSILVILRLDYWTTRRSGLPSRAIRSLHHNPECAQLACPTCFHRLSEAICDRSATDLNRPLLAFKH